MGMITTAWYISQPIVLQLSQAALGQDLSGTPLSLVSLVQFANIIWGPIFDGIILFWMVASAQARDIESEAYG